MSFAAKLKGLRMRSGKSLQQLADAIGISKAHLWDLESGKSSNPSADLLRKLSDELKVTVAWLVGEEPGDDDQLKVMFRQLQELDPTDREIVQAVIDVQKNKRIEVVQIDRMALDGIGNAVAIADALLRQLGDVPIPVPITEIAGAAGISEIKRLETKGFEGALIAPDHKATGVILVNERSRPERKRFTIGHELGHFLNPWHKPPDGGFRCTKEDMFAREDGGKARLKMEVEANEFSAEMLMPKAYFRRDLKKILSPGLEHVVEFATRYETSKLATARRFVDLLDDATAVVLTKDGIVEQLHRSRDFPFISLKRGKSVHEKSVTARFSGADGGCSDTDIVLAALWTEKDLRRGAEMYEQVLVQSGGYRITLLSIDESESDDEDDEYVRNRSEWRPRFH